MPQVCQVCQHRRIALIDGALVENASMRPLATEYGVSYEALKRHRREHLPALIREAHKRGVAEQGATVLERLEGHTKRLEGKLDDLEGETNAIPFIAAMREVRGQLTLMAELLGDIDNTPEIHLHTHPTWIAVRTTIIEALSDHPEAKQAVVLALVAAGEDFDAA